MPSAYEQYDKCGELSQQQTHRAQDAKCAGMAVAHDHQPFLGRANTEHAITGVHETVEVQPPREQHTEQEERRGHHARQQGCQSERSGSQDPPSTRPTSGNQENARPTGVGALHVLAGTGRTVKKPNATARLIIAPRILSAYVARRSRSHATHHWLQALVAEPGLVGERDGVPSVLQRSLHVALMVDGR